MSEEPCQTFEMTLTQSLLVIFGIELGLRRLLMRFLAAHEASPVGVNVTSIPRDREFAPIVFHLTR